MSSPLRGDWYARDLQLPGERVERETPTGAPFQHLSLTPEAAGSLAAQLRERTAALRALPLERILAALDESFRSLEQDWERTRSLWDDLFSATGYPYASLGMHLVDLSRSLRRPRLDRWVTASGMRPGWLDGVLDEARTLVFGPELTLVVSSGNVPGAALPSVVQALLLKSPVLVKSSAGEPVLLPHWAAELHRADPEVGRALAVCYWEGGDAAVEDAVLPQVGALVAYGSDSTLQSLRSRLPASARFLGYGSRISFSAIGRERLTRAGARSVAEAALLDCVRFEYGCLTPQAVYLEEGGELTPEEFGDVLSRCLGAFDHPMQRTATTAEWAAVHQYRARLEMASFQEGGPRVWLPRERARWTLVLERSSDLLPTPRHGAIVLRSVPDLSHLPEIAGRQGPTLISCTLDVAEERRAALIPALAAAGVTRFAPPGKAQSPEDPLLHDGINALSTLARWVHLEDPAPASS